MESDGQNSRDELFLERIREIILDNIANNQFGVEDLAKSIGVSRSQLYRKLQKLIKKSISQFIREIRLNEALKLLQKGTKTVSEISYSVGFSNPSYFNTTFKNYFGYPPGEAAVRKSLGEVPIELESKGNTFKTNHRFLNHNLLLFFLIVALLIVLVKSIVRDSADLESDNQPSIAILPFADMSPNKNQAHLIDGLSEEITHKLTGIKELKVLGRNVFCIFV